jgi:urease accessory protein
MLIQQKKGNLSSTDAGNKPIDWLLLEWFETRKRILRCKTASGREVALQFLNESAALTEGDILYEDERTIIAVTVLPCDCLVIHPKTMFDTASVCYEIGNKHLPLFFESDELLVPFEKPLYQLLLAQGYGVTQERRKLLQPLNTTVSPHGQERGGTLFSRIMKLTANE